MGRRRRRDPNMRHEQLRRSQSIAPFGVGSILDLPNESLMPMSIDYWSRNFGIVIHDERLQKRLGVNYFKMIPSREEAPDQGVPTMRFPRWLFCPKCRSFGKIDDWIARYKARNGKRSQWNKPECDICRLKLIPSSFVVACVKGHIDDFPWVDWVHRGNICSNPELTIHGGISSGLAGIIVKCRTCGMSNTMHGAFGREVHTKCTGYMPWLNKYEKCDAIPQTRQRGASNIYFPQVINSIVIPSYRDNLEREIRETLFWKAILTLKDPVERVNTYARDIAEDIGRDINEVKKAMERMLTEQGGQIPVSEIDYRYDEYRLFQGLEKDYSSTRDLEIELVAGEKYQLRGIKNVTLVHRLREVRALYAFSRLHPLERHMVLDEDDEAVKVQAVFVRGKQQRHWLPGIEVRGEGIFLEFNRDLIGDWENKTSVIKRAAILNNRYKTMAEERGLLPRLITPRFVFLHTLSHLLIRQLAFECGYGSASLRERIYCNETPEQPYMAGILIYTASGDADGTLGGLVRLGKPNYLSPLVANAITSGYWCSSDPLCYESQGQGLGSLNLAACHACTLLPETSCEEFNRLLDRALVAGLPDEPGLGFLSDMVRL